MFSANENPFIIPCIQTLRGRKFIKTLFFHASSTCAYAEDEKIKNSEFELVANFAVDNKIANYTPINIQTAGNCVEEVIQSTNWENFDINKENISNNVSIHLATKPNCEIHFRVGIGDPKNKWNVTFEEGKLLTVYLSGKISNVRDISYREFFSDL